MAERSEEMWAVLTSKANLIHETISLSEQGAWSSLARNWLQAYKDRKALGYRAVRVTVTWEGE